MKVGRLLNEHEYNMGRIAIASDSLSSIVFSKLVRSCGTGCTNNKRGPRTQQYSGARGSNLCIFLKDKGTFSLASLGRISKTTGCGKRSDCHISYDRNKTERLVRRSIRDTGPSASTPQTWEFHTTTSAIVLSTRKKRRKSFGILFWLSRNAFHFKITIQ